MKQEITVELPNFKMSGLHFYHLKAEEKAKIIGALEEKLKEINDLWPKNNTVAEMNITRFGPRPLSEDSLALLARIVKRVAMEKCKRVTFGQFNITQRIAHEHLLVISVNERQEPCC